MEAVKDVNPRHYARMWVGWHALEDDTCLVCGLTYVRESEQDRRLHRSRHRKVVQVYEPRRRLPPLGGGSAPPKKRERELEDA